MTIIRDSHSPPIEVDPTVNLSSFGVQSILNELGENVCKGRDRQRRPKVGRGCRISKTDAIGFFAAHDGVAETSREATSVGVYRNVIENRF
jgi:hypothetical protein